MNWLPAVALAMMAVGAQAADAPAPAALAGTWRWVSFIAPVEKLMVDAPDRYTLTFPDAGHIALKADCNRAAGGVTFGEGGSVKIGAMAMTRAMCPPDSLSDRFAREVGRATHWSMWDKDLLLELPADSGALRFMREP